MKRLMDDGHLKAQLKIEKGIEVTRSKKQSVYGDIAVQMQIGDSVNCKHNAIAQALANQLRTRGFKAVTRSDGRGNYRVWRIK